MLFNVYIILMMLVMNSTQSSPGCVGERYDWIIVKGYGLGSNNDKQIPGVTWEQCKKECLQLTEFRCLSFEHIKKFNNLCNLSKKNRASAGVVYKQFPDMGITYAEWFCDESPACLNKNHSKIWRTAADHHIASNNDKKIHGVTSWEDCQRLCLQNIEFLCLSIEYIQRSKVCVLSNSNRAKAPGQYNKFSRPMFVRYGEWYCGKDCVNGEMKWAEIKDYTMSINNDKEISGVTLEQCKNECTTLTEFTCLSVEHFPETNNLCILSKMNRATAANGVHMKYPGIKYAEWFCED